MLKPIWETKNQSAQRVQNYVYKIIQHAIADGLRKESNPAIWKDDLELAFPKASKVHKVKHHRFIAWQQLPDFMKALYAVDKHVGSRPDAACFAFMVLTVARPSEARLIDWKEIDLDENLWTVPAGKHKSSEEWKIPLCPQAMKILKAQPTRKGRVFSTLNNKEIPDAYLSSTPDALGFDAVAHGFRSTFRTWGQERVKSSEEALELSLKHLETSATRTAYARSQLFHERRRILNAYEKWIFKGDSSDSKKVVSINKRRKAS